MKFPFFILLTSLLAILAGCGGDGDSSTLGDTTDTPSSDTGSPNPPEATPPSSPEPEQPDIVDGNCTLSAEDIELLAAHNKARAVSRVCGDETFAAAEPLVWNCTLAKSSYNHSSDMAQFNFFSHTGSDGLSPFDRIENLGYAFRGAGENIAAGQNSVDAVMSSWLNSAGHCKNIMSAGFSQMGGAKVTSNSAQFSVYWTVNFATPRS